MDVHFTYEKPVSGKSFIGRKLECKAVKNLLASSQHIVLYDAPKTGKSSLIMQSMLGMKLESMQFSVCNIDALSVPSFDEFLLRFGNLVIRSCCNTPAEYEEVVSTMLEGTHFVFDRQRFAVANEVVSASWELDESDAAEMFRLPGRIAARRGENMYVVIDEFQRVAELENGTAILRSFKKVLQERNQGSAGCTFIFSGSRMNAMKEIFRKSPMFRGLVSHVPLERVEDMEIAEHIKKGVNVSGKVIEKDAVMSIIRRFDNNLWYINHFMAICDSRTKGFFNDNIFNEGLGCLLAIHEPRFTGIMCSLTGHQVSLLKAIIDGVTRFTAVDVIRAYGLNSSANVSRVKEALMKKEIITFNDKDEPLILDVLFRYWLENIYFTK